MLLQVAPGPLLATVRDSELEWQKRQIQAPDRCLPWMPSNIPQFLVLLYEALMEHQAARTYLEVGCGPGTKMILAHELGGLNVHGIELDPQMAAAAREGFGAKAIDQCDALGYDFYSMYDVVYVNRPFRDRDAELALENRIWEQMARGAAVICMNLEKPPPGWLPVTDDWEARRGVWIKP